MNDHASASPNVDDPEAVKEGLDASGDHLIQEIVRTVTQPPSAHPSFPEGGLDAWLTIFGCFLLSFTSYGQVNAFGVFQTYYASNQLKTQSASAISWIGGLQIALIYIGGIPLGGVMDSYGAKGLLICGWLLSSFSLMMVSLSKTYYQIILSHGVGFGIGMALQFYPLLVLPSHYFHKKRAAAMGIVVAGSSLSGVIFPIMISRLFDSIGFGWTVRTVAFLTFGLQAVSLPLVRERLPRNMKLPRVDKLAFSDVTFMLHVAGGFMAAFGLYAPLWYIEIFSIQLGVDANLSFYLISIMNAAGLIGRIVTGYMADRLGRFNVIVPTMGLAAISSLAIWSTTKGRAGLIAFSLIFGFTSAAYSSLAAACTAQLTPHPSKIGARVGMFMTGMAPGILTGPSIAGAILDGNNGKYLGLQIFIGVMLAASAALELGARFSERRHTRTFAF